MVFLCVKFEGLCFIIFIPLQAVLYSSVEALNFFSSGSAFTKAKLQHVEVDVTPPSSPARTGSASSELLLPAPQTLTGRRRAGC